MRCSIMAKPPWIMAWETITRSIEAQLTPAFSPLYYKWLKSFIDSTFTPTRMNPFLDQLLNTSLAQGTIDTMKAFNTAQVSNVLAQIPLTLTVSNTLTITSGYPRTTNPTVALFGTAN